MPTLELTVGELELVKRAITIHNDFMNDTLLENVESVNLFSREPQAVTPEAFTALRNELNGVVGEMSNLRVLMSKLGLETNSRGYSV